MTLRSLGYVQGLLEKDVAFIHDYARLVRKFSDRASAGNVSASEDLPGMVGRLAELVVDFRKRHAYYSTVFPGKELVSSTDVLTVQNFTQTMYGSRNLQLYSYHDVMQQPFVALLSAWRELSWENASREWFSFTEGDALDGYLFSLFSSPVGRSRDFVFIDIETTAEQPLFGDVIEVGLMRTTPDFTVKDVFHTLCDLSSVREREVRGTGSVVHNISPADVAGCPTFLEVAPVVDKFFAGDVTVVAHGAGFEWRWLSMLLPSFWSATTDSAGRVVRVVDTMLVTKFLMSGTPDNTLRSFVEGNGVVYKNPHRAFNDMFMMFEGFQNFVQRLGDRPDRPGVRPEFLPPVCK